MESLYIEYLPIAIFIAFAFGLAILFALSSWLIGKQLLILKSCRLTNAVLNL